jgi:uncharacterized RDD family membrane protein YckC
VHTDIQEDILGDLDLPPKPAPIFKRIVAVLFIDCSILSLIGFVLGYFWGERYTTEDGGVGFNLQGLPAFAWFFSWFLLMPLCEGVTGQTIGKRLLKIRVIKMDMSPATIGSSLVRHLFDMIDSIFLIGLVIASTNKERRRLGDLVAGTVVVEKEV